MSAYLTEILLLSTGYTDLKVLFMDTLCKTGLFFTLWSGEVEESEEKVTCVLPAMPLSRSLLF